MVNKVYAVLKNAYLRIGMYASLLAFLLIATANVFVVWKFAGFESTIHQQTQSLWTILSVCIYLSVLFWAYKRLKVTNGPLLLVVIGYILVVCSMLIFTLDTVPEGDIVDILPVAEVPKVSDFQPQGYLDRYPQQIGMLSVVWALDHLFSQPLLVFRFINLVLVVGMAVALYKIVQLMFENKNITKIFLLMLPAMLPIYFYTSFVYSDVAGLSLSIIGLFFALKFSKTYLIRHGLAAAVILGVAVTLRQNAMIYLVGVTLLYIFTLKKDSMFKMFCAWVAIPATIMLLSMGLRSFWEHHLNVDMNPKNATPSVAWVAMGMQDEKRRLPYGWWNNFNNECYNNNVKNDMKICNAESLSSIKESTNKFTSDPFFTMKFYWEKMASQWAEPTFQSINLTANNRINNHSAPEWQKPIGKSLNDYEQYGAGLTLNGVAKLLMDVSWLAFILLTLLWVIKRGLRLADVALLTPLIIVLGGFIFHVVIWEAKSRYILAYYPLILLYASAGAHVLFSYDFKLRIKNTWKRVGFKV